MGALNQELGRDEFCKLFNGGRPPPASSARPCALPAPARPGGRACIRPPAPRVRPVSNQSRGAGARSRRRSKLVKRQRDLSSVRARERRSSGSEPVEAQVRPRNVQLFNFLATGCLRAASPPRLFMCAGQAALEEPDLLPGRDCRAPPRATRRDNQLGWMAGRPAAGQRSVRLH